MTDQSFPDHEYLTVRELAELLRLKERKVYDLAASGAVPCSRATGKLLFPAQDIRAWILEAQSGGSNGTSLPQRSAPAPDASMPRPQILLGSHDPLLDWAIRQSRCGLATCCDGSLDGLSRFALGEGIATGLHLRDSETGHWNSPAARQAAGGQNAVLLHFAKRRRGLVYRDDRPVLSGLLDLAGLRLVPRQTASGTDQLFRDLAAKEGLELTTLTLADVACSEDDAVDCVRRQEADVAFGLEAVARAYGLAFTPIVEEEFGLLVDRQAWFEPPLQRLFEFCQSAAFRARAQSDSGYDISQLGRVVWNA